VLNFILVLNLSTVVDGLKIILPSDKILLSLYEPNFDENKWRYIMECLNNEWVSLVTKYVDHFEQKLARLFVLKKAIAKNLTIV
jgi:hypothetical protein